jgi:hypothetical protein
MKLPEASCGSIKAEFAEAQPAFALLASAGHLAIHPCSKLQDILAKANKQVFKWPI